MRIYNGLVAFQAEEVDVELGHHGVLEVDFRGGERMTFGFIYILIKERSVDASERPKDLAAT